MWSIIHFFDENIVETVSNKWYLKILILESFSEANRKCQTAL